MGNIYQIKPIIVTELEASYGAPSQAGFGNAVFYEKKAAADDLEKMAHEKYRYFVGDLWERFGEDAWMGLSETGLSRASQGQNLTSWLSCAASRFRSCNFGADDPG